MPPMIAEKMTVITRASCCCWAAMSSAAMSFPRVRSRNATVITVTRMARKAKETTRSFSPSVIRRPSSVANRCRSRERHARDRLRGLLHSGEPRDELALAARIEEERRLADLGEPDLRGAPRGRIERRPRRHQHRALETHDIAAGVVPGLVRHDEPGGAAIGVVR